MSLFPNCIDTKINSDWLREMLHYLWVGLLATGSQYLLLIACVEFWHSTAVLGSSLGYVLGGAVNYGLNHRHTFESEKAHRIALSQFIVVFIIAFVLNATLLHWLENSLQWHYLYAQFLTTFLVLGWNYSASKFWIFAKA